MAWQHTLYDASFRGIAFDYFGIDDSRAKSLATHQAPYADDAVIIDMGNNPKQISMTALLSGDDYEPTLDALIDALEAQGSGELVHPVFGTVNAVCASHSVKHDSDIVDGCTVEMQFIIAKPKRHTQYFKPEPMPTATQQADNLILSKPTQEMAEYQEQLDTMSNEVAVAQARSIPEQIRFNLRDIRMTLGTNLVRIDNLLSPPDWLGSIVSDVDSIVKMLPLGYDPMANWRRLFNQIKRIGNVFDSNDVAPLRRVGQVLPAAMISRGLLTVLEAEQRSPTLTPIDLVAITDEARANIQAAIDTIRNDEVIQNDHNLPIINIDITPVIADLKKAAAQLQTLVDAVINSRPPLITQTISVPSTWRLIAHQLYGDHNRATELSRLNRGLVDASNIMPGTQVVAYAI